ncbi:MAG: hypothetical protein FJ033_10590 [Chloroflexi bacterium]|nr:hypothetical protein [Chloroflexota bacterium]
MSLEWAESGPSDEQRALCEMISDRAALALQNAILGVRAAEVEAVREVSRPKSDLVTKVSHDLTTPLGVILGYAEMLAGRASDPKPVQRMAEKISGSARHLARLVDDLLDAGRLESGRFALDLQHHDLRDLCTEAIETARVAHAGPRFELDLPVAPLPVRADPVRIRQILLNLLSNAARYGPSDGRIRLRAGQTADVVAVTVEDEGTGIPATERERVFDKFYRVAATTGVNRKGMGLDLSIARDLVIAHQGEIWIESGEWGGARFHIALPVAACSVCAEELTAEHAAT